MDKIASAKFRTTYTTITAPVTVTVNGHAIGTWLPSPFSPHEFRTGGTGEAFLNAAAKAINDPDVTAAVHPFGKSRPAPKPSRR